MAEQQSISADGGNGVFPTQSIREPKPPPSGNPSSMKVYLSTFPGLGQITYVAQNTTIFTALLEVDAGRADDPWQVSLWHAEGTEWQESPMVLSKDPETYPISLQSSNLSLNLRKLYFTTPLAIPLPTSFTIKFRNGSKQSWKWVKEHQGTPDGTVLSKSVTPQESISSHLGDYIEGLNPILQSKSHRSQSPGTALWSVETPIDAVDGDNSTVKDIKFGIPWGDRKFSR